MRAFNSVQRKIYGEKAVEFSLVSAGGLIFAQFFSTRGFSLPLMIVGVVLSAFGLIMSYFLLKDVKDGEKL